MNFFLLLLFFLNFLKNNYSFLILQLIYLHCTKCESVCLRREIPAISLWTTDMIKKRQSFEINNGGFGILDRYEDDINDNEFSRRKVCFNNIIL